MARKIISKIEKETKLTMSLLLYIGVYYLFYCECPLGCEVGLTVFHDLFMKIVAFQDTMVHSIQSLQQFNKDNPCGKN